MTELLSQPRLQEMAAAIGEPHAVVPRPILVRRWEIDTATGRPVCRWEVESWSCEAPR
jgi:hypothetical protein